MKIENGLYLGGRLGAGTGVRMLLKCLFGGVAYGLLEVMWRGYTHPSMVVTGGICFSLICTLNGRLAHRSLLCRSAACTACVTALEFCVGILVNHVLRMGVWDYSDEWMHLLGQICPLYSCFWFGLCLALSFLLPHIHLSVIYPNFKK